MKKLDWVLLIFLSMLWGGSFFFSKVALAELQPFTIVLGRVSLAALVLIGLVRITGDRMPTSRKIWGMFFVMGFLNNLVPFSLIFYGQTQINSGLASILNATAPLWTILLAHFFTRDEKITRYKMIGVGFGLTGIVTLIGWGMLQGLNVNILAQLAVVGAAISYAVAGIYGKRIKGISPIIAAACQVTATTIMMLPVALLVDRPWQQAAPGVGTILSVIALGLLSTALAYIIYFRLLATAGATNLLLVTFLIPVSAVFLGATFLKEAVDLRQIAGMLLIGLGLAFVDGRLPRRIKQVFQRSEKLLPEE